ncbi:LAQU0S12e03356g1_1 [Lachancea quebecensis]|uniref:LAQU0S12e03356g1_1 n=1 Tax=Lachancea quebecensis TaxID=1654605 RepID=A0A0P1KV65_9SACH|nr:LAQU0S12e03356g1_1 [Lachancea quebecensis]
MNSGNGYQPDPLGSVGTKFEALHLSGASTPMLEGGSLHLHKTPSLLDNIGIQRANSPFVSVADDTYLARQQLHQQQQPQPHPVLPVHSHSSTSLALDWAHQGNVQVPANGNPQNAASAIGYLPNSLASEPVGIPPPPGVFAPRIPIVESQWKYIDFQGMIQGPFPTQSMTSWLQAGYLQSSLQVARVATTPEPFGVNDTFAPLGDLMAKVGDFTDPFNKLDLIVSQAQTKSVPQSSVNKQLGLESLSLGVTNATITNSAPASSIPDNVPSMQSLNGELHDAILETNDYTHNQVLGLRDDDGGFYQEVVSRIPVDKFVENLDKIDTSSSKAIDGQVKARQQIDQEAVQRRLDYEEKQKKEKLLALERAKEQELLKHQNGFASSLDESNAKRLQSQEKANAPVVSQEEVKRRRAEEASRKLIEDEERAAQEKKDAAERRKRQESKKSTKETSAPSPSPAAKPTKPAPWASKAAQPFSGSSLAEIQQKESAQRASRKQEHEEQARELAVKLQKQVLNEEASVPRIDSIASWASKKSVSGFQGETKPPVKTIEQVQKEQLEQKKFLAEQKRLWEEAQKTAKIKATSAPSNETKEWTTVTKKQALPLKSNSSKAVNQPNSYLSPDKLRAASATTSKQIGSSTSIPTLKARTSAKVPASYTGNQSTSLRQEFLKWCKSQMKLAPDVDVNGVLEVLLSLPAGPESKEIIADTIYSNSLSMDGRRFAAEFIKRRVDCESKLNDALSWSEALKMPEGDVEDWEFQVVGKKKNRKH